MQDITQPQPTASRSKQAADLHAPRGIAALTAANAQATTALEAAAPANQPNSPSRPATRPSWGPDFDIPDQPHEIRRDYIFDEYAIIAPGRHKRPFDFKPEEQPLIETAQSPKLEEQPAVDSLGGNGKDDWHVRSVANKFPALTLQNQRAYGTQEIIIDTPLSNMPMARLSPENVCEILAMYQRRIKSLGQLPHIKYVQVFKNEGRHAGASLAHSHTQVFALPIVPPRFVRRNELVEAYVKEKTTNPYEDIIAFEIKARERLIADDSFAVAIAPYASAWPLEAWILPKRHMQSFVEATQEELVSIASMLLKLLRKLDSNRLNFNFFIEEGVGKQQRWALKIYGRDVVSPLGGLEVATGVVINTIPPESAAKWYKS